ncbi:MAG TPA: hypothetical protein VF236_06965 [Gaiellaceae bacterium]
MRGVFFSPRMRRRLAWSAAALAIVGGAVAAGVLWPNTVERPPSTFSGQQAYVYDEPDAVELSRIERAKALSTAANFVTHAVARRRVDLAYDLTAPSLRGGLTRAQWNRGTIPVVPFPVDEARWKIEYSYRDALGLQVLLLPTAKSKLRPAVFVMELLPKGRGKSHGWQVASWAPTGMTGGGAPAVRSPGAGGVPNLGATLQRGEARLDAKWLFAPFALFALVPLVVGGFYFRSWRRGRQAEAAYRASR